MRENDRHAPRPRVAYLARVRAGLHLPEGDTTEVIEELAAHFSDATEALRAEGLTEDQAEREAMARLGSPDALADEIRRSHQTTRRALAAAGGGVFAAVTSGLYGLILGWALVVVGMIVVGSLAMTVGRSVGVESVVPSRTTGTVMGAVVWSLAGFFAARAATRRFAVTARRSITDVRPGLALLAAAFAGVVSLNQPVYLDALAVVAVLLIPAAAAFGALRAREVEARPRRRQRIAVAGLVVVAVVFPVLAMALPPTGGSGALGPLRTQDEYLAYYGPRYAPMGELRWDDFQMATASFGGGEAHLVEAELNVPASLATWSDIRLEGWLRDPADDAVLAGETQPFAASAPLAPGAQNLTLEVGRLRDVGPYFTAVAGTSPEGERVILVGPVPMDAVFRGSVIDWMGAPSARD